MRLTIAAIILLSASAAHSQQWTTASPCLVVTSSGIGATGATIAPVVTAYSLAKRLDAPEDGDLRKAIDLCEGHVYESQGYRALEPQWLACEALANSLRAKQIERSEEKNREDIARRREAEGANIAFVQGVTESLGIPMPEPKPAPTISDPIAPKHWWQFWR